MNTNDYPVSVVKDVLRLRERIAQSTIPHKNLDQNLVIGTWNIRAFGSIFNDWSDNPDSPKRNLHALALIAEIIRRFDVIAIQEIKTDTGGVRKLLDSFLGKDFGLLISDVSAGSRGNHERLGFIYDKRRVQPTGLAGEIVLPVPDVETPVEQFDRTPYIAGFESGSVRFSLLTTHIRYGNQELDRLTEIQNLAEITASEMRKHALLPDAEEHNLIVLGDFNIEKRGENPLFKAFCEKGLFVPGELMNFRTTYGSEAKFYDQIAWFMGDLDFDYNNRAGVIDFAGAVFQEMNLRSMSYRLSDHFPLWAEFIIDKRVKSMAETLGLDPSTPESLIPLDNV